jgi:hypothetical protein
LKFKVNPGKNFTRLHVNKKELGMVAPICHPSYGGKSKIGGSGPGQPRKKSETLSPKKQEQKGLGM